MGRMRRQKMAQRQKLMLQRQKLAAARGDAPAPREQKMPWKLLKARRERFGDVSKDPGPVANGGTSWQARARAWGLNPPDVTIDDDAAGNGTRPYRPRPSAPETRLDPVETHFF